MSLTDVAKHPSGRATSVRGKLHPPGREGHVRVMSMSDRRFPIVMDEERDGVAHEDTHEGVDGDERGSKVKYICRRRKRAET